MSVTNYLWDEESYLEEYDELGTTTAAYTNEPTGFGNVISQRRDSTTNFYHYDGIGSTSELSNSAENVTDTFLYNAWGNVITLTGTTINYFRWIGNVGYYWDEEIGNYYVRARIYEPAIGRWISTDPLQFVDGINLYLAYFIPSDSDPSGEQVRRKAPVKPQRKPLKFKACCSYNRSCYDCYPLPPETAETKTLTADCELAPGEKPTAKNLGLAANRCCSDPKNKPWNNWWNPYKRCSYWIATGRVGSCGKDDTLPATGCQESMLNFFDMLDKWVNGAPPGIGIPTPENLYTECAAFCQCLFPASKGVPGAKTCIDHSFCNPVLSEAGATMN
tara:strand:+ start:4112 stop:5107 length:996 start_codon:yes stop_codon:yes gene_type:complete